MPPFQSIYSKEIATTYSAITLESCLSICFQFRACVVPLNLSRQQETVLASPGWSLLDRNHQGEFILTVRFSMNSLRVHWRKWYALDSWPLKIPCGCENKNTIQWYLHQPQLTVQCFHPHKPPWTSWWIWAQLHARPSSQCLIHEKRIEQFNARKEKHS